MIDIKTRAKQIMTQMVLDKAKASTPPAPKPPVDYRQGAVPYSTLPSNRPSQIVAQSATKPNGYFAPAPEQVRTRDIVRELPNALYQATPIPSAIKGVGLITGAVGGLFGAITGAVKEYDRQISAGRQIIPSTTTGSTPMAILKTEPAKLDAGKIYNAAVDYAKETAKTAQKAGETISPYIAGFALSGGIAPALAKIAFTGLGTYITAQGVQSIADEYGRVDEEAKMGNTESKALSAAYKKGGSTGLQLFGIDQAGADALAATPWGAAIGNGLLFTPGITSIVATPKVMRGTAEVSKLKFKNLTKDTLKQYNIPTTVDVPADVVFDWQTGRNKIPLDDSWDIALKSLTAKERAMAARNGVKITLPLEYIVKLVDKPYWANIKNKIGLTPINKVVAKGVETGRITVQPATQPIAGQITTPVSSATRQLPTGVSATPVIPPIDSTQVAFQIPDVKKSTELNKAKTVLQNALDARRAIIDSGRATPKAKEEFQQLTTAINFINKQIETLQGQQIKTSGPVVTPEQQASMVRQPVVAPTVTAPVSISPSRITASTPEIRSATSESISKMTKPEFLDNLDNIKSIITTEIYNKAKALIAKNIAPTFVFNEKGRQIINVKDSGKIIKGEHKITEGKPLKIETKQIKPTILPAEKPIPRRILATAKREVKLTQAQEEATRLKEIAAIRAANEAKPKSYKEMLARANAKKEAVKQAEIKTKAKTIREYLLERKIQQETKAGKMTTTEATKARIGGKINIARNEIEYKKGKDSIDTAEAIGSLQVDKDFKLFEHGYRLVKKYTKKTEGVVSEKNVPRGAAGAAYKTGTTRFKSLNSIHSIVHEITHIIDRTSGLRGKITNDKVINELINIYRKYYLNDIKTTKDDAKAISEGLATFIERYALFPTKTKGEYPILYKEFLGENGLYHDQLFNELIDDTQSILKQYQGLDALGKFMARMVDNNRNVDVKSFYGVTDKLKAYFFNTGWILEKAGQYTGLERTSNDPYLWLETYRLWNQAFAHNVTAVRSRFKKETYITLDKNGNFNETHNFNWGSIINNLGNETNVSRYGGYLFARDTHFNYKELIDLNKEIANNKNKIKELEQEFASTQAEDLPMKIKGLKNINEELSIYAKQKNGMLEKRNIPQTLADEAYNLNKAEFIEQDKMFDTLVRENLDTLHLAKLIKPELYNYLIKKKGYAPTYVDYIDEILGTHELGDALLDNPSFTIRGKEVKSLIARVGSEKAIKNPLMQAIINEGKNLPKAIQQMVYNKFGEIAGQLPDYAVNEIEYNPLMKDRNNTVIAIDDMFKKHAYKVDKNLKRLFDTAFTPKTIGVFQKVLAKSSKLFTASTTGIYSAFAIVNIPIDSISAFIQSKNRFIPIIDSLKKSIDLLQKNPATKKYVDEYFSLMGFRNTAIGSIYYAQTLEDSLSLIKTDFKKSIGGKFESGLDKTIDVLSFPSQASEILTRLTEYINSREAGNPQIVAREDSTRVSAPFVHRGYVYPLIQPAVYVNAGLQVLDMTFNSMNRMWREFRGTKNDKDKTNVIGRFSLITVALTAIALTEIGILLKKLKEAKTPEEKNKAQKSIDDYNNMSIYERSNFLRSSILADKPNIIRVPSNYATLSNFITMLVADKYLESNFTPKEYAELFSEALPLPQSWTGYLPYFPKQIALISLGFKDFPKLKQLEQDYMKNITSEERYYATTPVVAKWLGDTSIAKAMDLSPIKINEFINMFGRGIYRQFFGEWDSTKNPIENIYNSMVATWENAIFKKDYLFIGREFEKFYAERDKLSYEITSGKKTYEVIQDKNLRGIISNKMQRSQLYSNISDFITKVRNIDSAGITVPDEYVNNIYNIVSKLNLNKDAEALKSLLELNGNRGFINFIMNSERKLQEQKTENIKTKFEKEQSRGNPFSINVANAAELNNGLPERQILPGETQYKVINDRVTEVIKPVYLKDAKGNTLYTFDNKIKPIQKATIYHPMNARETKPNPNGIGSIGVKLKFGDVAISYRGVNDAIKKAAKDNKFLYIYVKELDHIKTPYGNGMFRVLDTKNSRFADERQIDFVSDDIYGTKSYPYTKMERELVKAKTLQYFVK